MRVCQMPGVSSGRMRHRRGYTLTELVVALVVLMSLMAAAMPSMLNMREAAQDAVARASVMNAYTTAKAHWNADRVYPDTPELLAQLGRDHPGLTFVSGTVPEGTDPKVVYVGLTQGKGAINVCARSASGTAWCLQAVEPGAPLYPSVALTTVPEDSMSRDATVEFVAFGSLYRDGVTCALNGAAAEPCESPWVGTDLIPGEQELVISATGPAGTSEQVVAWTIGSVAPTVNIDAAPHINTHNSDARVDFTAAPAYAATQCQIDAGAWEPCDGHVEASGLAMGAHTIRVRATTAAGSVTETVSWTRAPYENVVMATPGLHHYYRMNEGNPGANNVTWDARGSVEGYGLVFPGAAYPASAYPGPGMNGNGRHFTGGGSGSIGGSTTLSMTNASFSIQAWVRVNQEHNRFIFSRGTNTPNQWVSLSTLRWDPASKMQSIRFSFWGAENDLDTPPVVPDFGWVHITATYDRPTDTARVYLNGKLSVQSNAGPYLGTANNFNVAGALNEPARAFHGVIDDLAIYNRALTPAEVAALMPTRP